MTPIEYKSARTNLGLTQTDLAWNLKVTPKTITARENGRVKIDREARAAIEGLSYGLLGDFLLESTPEKPFVVVLRIIEPFAPPLAKERAMMVRFESEQFRTRDEALNFFQKADKGELNGYESTTEPIAIIEVPRRFPTRTERMG